MIDARNGDSFQQIVIWWGDWKNGRLRAIIGKSEPIHEYSPKLPLHPFMNKPHFRVWLMAVCILGLAVALWREHRSNLALEQDIRDLRAQSHRGSTALEENDSAPGTGASNPATNGLAGSEYLELMRLRGEVGALRKQLSEPGKAAKKVRQAEVPPPVDEGAVLHPPVPLQNVQFMGYGTPEDALQSLMFALKSGDTNMLLNSVTPESVPSILKEWEGKTQAEILEMLQKDLSDMESLDFSKKTTSDSGVVHFVIAIKEQVDGDTKSRDETVVHFTNVNGGWKFSEQ